MLDRSREPDDPTPRRQPVFNIPTSVVAILIVLIAIHIVRQVLPDRWDDLLFSRLAFVPGRLTFAFAPDRVVGTMVALAGQGAEGYRSAQAERFFLGDGSLQPWTTVTYALLHADWAHIGLNGIWFLAFGTPMARRFGALRFFVFLVVAAWAGAIVQWAAHPLDLAPVIGASAAVSGCMGATLRFMFQPRVPMSALLDTAVEGRSAAFVQPALTLRALSRDRRAVTFVVAWFATNLVFGLGSISFGLSSGPIAWEAHVGGFLSGLLLFGLIDPVPRTLRVDLAPSSPEEPDASL